MERADPSCNLLAGSGKHTGGMAHPCGVCARVAIANVARDRASIVSRNRTSVLVAGCPAIAEQVEMARIVDTLVSLPGYLAVRYPFRIFGLLRPRGLPRIFVFTAIVWPDCSGRSAMRGCVDVDLRDRRLLDCRDTFRSTFTLPSSVGRAVDFAIRVGTQCDANGPAADGGCLNVQPVHSYRATRLFQVARRAFCGLHTLRLLGTYETRGQLPHSDHDWCRFLSGLRKRSTTVFIPGIVQHSTWNVAGRKRDRDIKPIHRTKSRCANAPYGAAPRRSWPSQATRSPGLRNSIGHDWQHISRHPSTCSRVSSRSLRYLPTCSCTHR